MNEDTWGLQPGTSALTLTAEQSRAVDAIINWWERTDRQFFVLAGFAGSGKTTIIVHVRDRVGGNVIVGAPTGKAAARLREKWVRAATIHLLAYKLEGVDDDGDPIFSYRGLSTGKAMVIIDEASMVDAKIFHDLVSSGYRMLFVGDHGQLPPVGEDPGLMAKPDFVLTEILRQDDQGLLDFAHELRQGAWIPEPKGAVKTIMIPPSSREGGFDVDSELMSSDVVICWRNATRHRLNLRIMNLMDIVKASPNDDPRRTIEQCLGKTIQVVCLKNNYALGFFNGEVLDVVPYDLHGDTVKCYVRGGPDDGFELTASTLGFGRDAKDPRRAKIQRDHLLVDFGYCLTAHKSQGSEWPKVCVWDETFHAMRDRQRWAYTAATRAQHELVWIRR